MAKKKLFSFVLKLPYVTVLCAKLRRQEWRTSGKLHTLNLSGRIFHSGHHPELSLGNTRLRVYVFIPGWLVAVSYWERERYASV